MPRKKITDGMRQKPNGVWELSCTIDGRQRWFSSKDPKKVLEKRDNAIAESRLQTQKKIDGPLFCEVASMYEAKVKEMKEGTQKSYLPAIRRAVQAFGNKRMTGIEPYMISVFLESMKTCAHTTVSNQKTVINEIFRTWINSENWKGNENPAKLVTMPRGLKRGKREPPTDEQIQIVKQHYLDSDALPAVVFLCTGERRGEACAIQLKDIDFENNLIKIYKSVNTRGKIGGTKTKSGVRTIPLLDMLKKALEPLRFQPPDTFILSGTNVPLTGSQYQKKWTTFWKKYGFAHSKEHLYHYTNRKGERKEYHHTEWTAEVCAHQFRHEYVCMLCEYGIEESVAIQLVGHANAKMIHDVYMSLKPKMIDDVKKVLNGALAAHN